MRRGDRSKAESEKSTGGDGRTERIEMRLRVEDKRAIESAASVGGEDVSSFLRRAGLTEARRLLATMPP